MLTHLLLRRTSTKKMQLSRVLLVAAMLLATLLASAQGRVVDLAQGNLFDEGISAGPWFVMLYVCPRAR
jgi:hypothetical protein